MGKMVMGRESSGLMALLKKLRPSAKNKETGSETGAPASAALRFTLRHAPFLGQRYTLAASLLLIDARDVLADPQGGALPSGARMADCVLLSHGDLMPDEDFGLALAAVRAWVPDKLVMPANCGVEALATVGLH